MDEKKNKIFGLIPFFYPPEQSEYRTKIDCLKETVQDLKLVAHKVIVVDDGAGLTEDIGDVLIRFPQNKGKAEAIRQGFRIILADEEGNPEYIVQADADKDQDPKDARLLLTYFSEQNFSSNQAAVVIGDRYSQSSETLSEYRQGLLLCQAAFCSVLGYQVRDPFSGLRAYTAEYAKRFLELSHSSGYGVELEQIVIANLIGATVGTVPLTYSRLRDPWTLTDKYLQNLNVVTAYADALRSRGLQRFVDRIEDIQREMGANADSFTLDLHQFKIAAILNFRRIDNKYTIKIDKRGSLN